MISFIYPLWFAAIPLGLVGLFFLFKKGGSIETTRVSSLFLLKNLDQEVQQRKNRSFPLRFFVELALLCLLGLLLTSPTLPGIGNKYLLLVDNSPSMAAKMPSGEPTLEAAIHRADTYLSQQSLGSSFAVWVTSPHLHAVQSGFEGTASTRARLEQIRIGFGEDALSSAINELQSSQPDTSLVVFSDYAPRDSQHVASGNVVEMPPIVPQGSERANFAIERAARNAQGQLAITLYANAEGLKLSEKTSAQISTYDSGKWTLVNTVTVKSGENLFPLSGTALQLLLRIVIQNREDSSVVDNTYYLSNGQDQSQGIVISNRSERELGLSKISTVQLTRMSPDDFTKARDSLKDAPLIFDSELPSAVVESGVARNSSLVILPLSGNVTVKEAKTENVASFISGHSLLRYLNPTLLSRSSALPLISNNPATEKVIIGQGGNPLLVASHTGAVKTIYSGFRLLPFEGAKSPIEGLLLLNSLRWISVAEEQGGTTDGELIENVLAVSDEATVREYGIPSIYKDASQKISVRNYFNEQESSLSRNQISADSSSGGSKSGSLAKPRDYMQGLEKLLAVALVLLFLLDISLVSFARRYGAGSR